MANIITFRDKICPCSNGCMDVLLTVLGLSGSCLARTDDEKNMVVWLMEHDQSAIGIGCAGFDITGMPWTTHGFEAQKQFMLRVLAGAREKLGWETLWYTPNEAIIFDRLAGLQDMFLAVEVKDIDEELAKQWIEESDAGDPIRRGYPMCQEHGIYKSVFGCIACNDHAGGNS